MRINVVGLDIAKHVFQVHAADLSGGRLRRLDCGALRSLITSAHYPRALSASRRARLRTTGRAS